MSERDLSTSMRQVFGDVEKGTECRICGRNVTDGRAKFCSEYCRRLAKAVMGMVNWSSVRRRIVDRDNKTCQRCGFDRRYVEKGQRHLRNIIKTKLPDRPKSPSILRIGDGDVTDEEMSEYFDRVEEWNEQRDRLRDRYGDEHQYDAPRLEVDHITPVSEGGHPFDPGNLQTLCTDCHKEKTASEAAERAERRTPGRPDIEAELADFVSGGGA